MTAPNQTLADLQIMHNATLFVQDTVVSIGNQLRALQNEVETLINSPNFKGQFASVYTDVQYRWSDDANKLLAALDKIANLMNTNHSQYATTDADQAQQMTRAGRVS